MQYEITDSFATDFKGLNPEHRAAFKKVVPERFAAACDDWAAAQQARAAFVWPKSLGVADLRGTSGVMRMTWSFAAPDGRAT